MVVGESPGADEDRLGRPFVGAAGREFDRELGQAHWSREAFFITNVAHERPPNNEVEKFFSTKTNAKRAGIAQIGGRWPLDPIVEGLAQLQRDIDEIEPTLIIALGNTAMWALTGQTGILRWRGSVMPASGGPVDGHGIKLVVGLHPAYVLREQVFRFVAISDLKRAKRESASPSIAQPTWRFTVPASVGEARDWFGDHALLDGPPRPVVSDVENIIYDGSLICLGFAAGEHDAMCVPFQHKTGTDLNYWGAIDDEWRLTLLCRDILRRHDITFHNGLHDCQIIAHQWGFLPRMTDDTMVKQNVAFPGMLGGKIDPITGTVDKKGSSLSLSFCASLYCDHYRFWKDDGRGWDAETDDEHTYWLYNCQDCVRTAEIAGRLDTILARDNLIDQYRFEMSLFEDVFEMMFRGVRFDAALRKEFKRQVAAEHKRIEQWIRTAVGHDINVRSSTQMKDLFYNDLQCPIMLDRKTRRPTLNDKALDRIVKRMPVLRPLVERIQALRTIGTFEDNFLQAQLRAADDRLCGAFNVGFVETMRFSSNVDAFGGGLNLQNLPRNTED